LNKQFELSTDNDHIVLPSFGPADPLVLRYRRAWAACVVMLLVFTLARALRSPHNYIVAHFLLSYEDGGTRRALIGSLLSLAKDYGLPSWPIHHIAATIGGAAIIILVALFSVIWTRFLIRTSSKLNAALLTLAIATSPFVVMMAHLISYFDAWINIFTIISLVQIRRQRMLIPFLLCVIGTLMHEAYVAFALPVLIYGLYRFGRTKSEANRTSQSFRLNSTVLILLSTSIIGSMSLVNWSNEALAPQIRLEMTKTLLMHDMPWGFSINFSHEIFGTYERHFKKQFFSGLGLFRHQTVLWILPMIWALLVEKVGQSLRPSWERYLRILAIFSPMLLTILACDHSRFAAQSLFCALLVFWIDMECGDDSVSRLLTTTWGWFGQVIWNIMIPVSLLELEDENFPFQLRALVATLFGIGTWFYLRKQKIFWSHRFRNVAGFFASKRRWIENP
jgi:hypothetical protein